MRRLSTPPLISFPTEIWFDIFSRLPIKALYQCRYVCKEWYENWNIFVTNQFLVNLHCSRIHNIDDSSFFIFCCTNKIFSKLYLVDYGNYNTSTIKAHNTQFHLPREKFKIIGYSNGLICISLLSNHECIYVCNPITKEVLQLPTPHYEKNFLQGFTSYGFAFDATTNKYKVFCIQSFNKFLVYTLGSLRWRILPNVAIKLFKPLSSALFLNGSLHFEAYAEGWDLIDAVDVGTEKFKSFRGPCRECQTRKRTLTLLDEYLCMMDDKDEHIVLWIMKNYGDEASWSREYVIRKKAIGSLQGIPLKVLRTTKKKFILLLGAKAQGYYDLEKEEFKQVLIDGISKKTEEIDGFVLVGSLISPKRIEGIITSQIHGSCIENPSLAPRPKRNIMKPSRFRSYLNLFIGFFNLALRTQF